MRPVIRLVLAFALAAIPLLACPVHAEPTHHLVYWDGSGSVGMRVEDLGGWEGDWIKIRVEILKPAFYFSAYGYRRRASGSPLMSACYFRFVSGFQIVDYKGYIPRQSGIVGGGYYYVNNRRLPRYTWYCM
jgi:hypothetical protein